MKLNIHIISDELANLASVLNCSDSISLNLDGIRFFFRGLSLVEHYLYIADEEIIPVLETLTSPVNILYIGSPDTGRKHKLLCRQNVAGIFC